LRCTLGELDPDPGCQREAKLRSRATKLLQRSSGSRKLALFLYCQRTRVEKRDLKHPQAVECGLGNVEAKCVVRACPTSPLL
jgi:hypothetical protein